MRMSASSSTIRMSCAMIDGTQLHRRPGSLPTLFHGFGAHGAAQVRRKHQPDPGAGRLAVLEHQFAEMIFHDLFYDGEAQSRALRPGCHVWLRQPLAAVQRQALAVVVDDDRYLAAELDDRHDDMPGSGR